MSKTETPRRLRDEYKYPGFYPSRYVEIPKWAYDGRIVRLTRRSKKLFAVNAERFSEVGTIARHTTCEIFLVLECGSTLELKSDELTVGGAAR